MKRVHPNEQSEEEPPISDCSFKLGNKEVRYPIIQGGMSVRIALHELAAAVAENGGVGTIGGMAIPPDELRQEIRKVRRLTSGAFGVNLMYAGYLFDELLDVCIQECVDYVAIGAGFARGPFRKLDDAGIPGAAIISSPKAARIAARTRGVAAVVVESGEAGGHLGPKDPEISIWDLFPPVYSTLRERDFSGPIFAAGGLLTRDDIWHIMDMGADGAQLGTRFATSEESAASEAMKKTWIKAKDSQVVNWSPTGMPIRIIKPHHSTRNLPTLNNGALSCNHCLKTCKHRDDQSVSHCIRKALNNSQTGVVDRGVVLTGSRIGEIDSIRPVSEIMDNLTQVFD